MRVFLLLLCVGCGTGPIPKVQCQGECEVADMAVADGPLSLPDLARVRDLATARDLSQPATPDLAPPGDPLQPATDPDDPGLLDPNRPSNCTRTALLDPAQLAGFFPDGSGFWDPAAGARKSDATTTQFTDESRTCNNVTGCGSWTYFVPNTNPELLFFFTYDDTNQLWIQQYDRFGQLITQRQIASSLSTASFAVENTGGSSWRTRRFAVMLTQTRICIETLVTSTPNSNGSTDHPPLRRCRAAPIPRRRRPSWWRGSSPAPCTRASSPRPTSRWSASAIR
jgi:hypothetical protein